MLNLRESAMFDSSTGSKSLLTGCPRPGSNGYFEDFEFDSSNFTLLKR